MTVEARLSVALQRGAKMKVSKVLSLVLMLIAPTIARAADDPVVTVGSVSRSFPGDGSVFFGEVYGVVKFDTDLRKDQGIRDFLDTLIEQKFGIDSKEGSFLVTVAVLKGGDSKPLAELPILSATRKEKKLLWFTTQSSLTGAATINGTVLPAAIVDEGNNDLLVTIKVYRSNKVTFDTQTFDQLIKITNVLKIASLIAVPELITGNVDSATKLLDMALSRETSQTLSLGSEMSFIKAGAGQPNPNKQRFRVHSTSNSVDHVFNIDITFETRPSLIGAYDTAPEGSGHKGFKAWAAPGKFLHNSKLQLGSAPIAINDIIEKTGPKEIATAWTTLTKGAYDPSKNSGLPIGAVCEQLFGLLQNVYTLRDAVGLYWDILHTLKSGLSETTNGKRCVEDRAQLFQENGLEITSLSAISK